MLCFYGVNIVMKNYRNEHIITETQCIYIYDSYFSYIIQRRNYHVKNNDVRHFLRIVSTADNFHNMYIYIYFFCRHFQGALRGNYEWQWIDSMALSRLWSSQHGGSFLIKPRGASTGEHQAQRGSKNQVNMGIMHTIFVHIQK